MGFFIAEVLRCVTTPAILKRAVNRLFGKVKLFPYKFQAILPALTIAEAQ